MIRLHNTLTKKVENFTTIEEGKVKMFVCGPTVYDFSHLGHAKTYVQLDLLARVLRANNLDVFYLQNITDIDDKIIDRAHEKNIDWQDLRSEYQVDYEQDMKSLNNVSVNQYARATDHIDDIIRQVNTLLEKGNAYVIDGDGIYFEISTFPEYGKLSGRTEIQKNDAQTRIDASDNKRGWNDFALWKFSKPGEPEWDAPFGAGRPGWHIEDTAITEHFFGPQYDLHGGAIDLIFPHHEAEITQMESASGKKPFVRTWVHTDFLTIEDEKMSKSLGNFYTIREVIEKGYDPMAIRLFMLQSHYRAPINFTYENLNAAVNRLKRWRNVAALRHQTHDTLRDDDEKSTDDKSVSLYATSQAFLEALNDDLNTSEAFKIIEEAFNRLNTVDDIHQHALVSLLESIDEVFGLRLLEMTSDINDEVKQLIIERERARDEKNWGESDRLRTEIEKFGITIRDDRTGTVWEYAIVPKPPFKPLPIVTVTLDKIVGGGQTIGTLKDGMDDGRKVFVWGGLPTETVEVQLTKKKSKMAEGIVTNVITPSNERVEPRDPESYISTSPWQILSLESETHYKSALIEEAFELHDIVLPEAIEVYTDGNDYAYRNKVEFSWYWNKETEELDLAFFRRGTHGKIPVDGTSLARPEINQAALAIRDLLRTKNVNGFDLKTLLIRSNQDGDVIAQLYVKDPEFSMINEKQLETLPIKGWELIYSNKLSPASVVTERRQQWGMEALDDAILGVSFTYATEGFFQINLPVYEQSLKDIKEWIPEKTPVVDLYSGVGTIGLTVTQNPLTLVELNPAAVGEMKRNIEGLGRTNATAILAASENALDSITTDATIIVDPPRAGLHQAVVERLLDQLPERIIYLSCNPVTQARDIALLGEEYGVQWHRGYNFFPHTPHIEQLVILSKIK